MMNKIRMRTNGEILMGDSNYNNNKSTKIIVNNDEDDSRDIKKHYLLHQHLRQLLKST